MERAPRRTCVGCRTTRAKPELWRFAVTPEGVAVDRSRTLPGRGAYVCPDLRCIERIERTSGQQLRRALPAADITTTTAALTELRNLLETADGGPGAAGPPARQASRDSDTDRSTTT